MPDTKLQNLLTAAANVRPNANQLRWFDREFYAFMHFGMNSFTNREWGLGNEDPALFDPAQLDCDQWVEAVKAAGMRAIILTAKHHDGFCLWPTKTTEHCVRNSPFRGGKGDIVRELSDACARGGIGFGVYLSPWDRNAACYGTDEYNDFYKAQLTELLTNYGELCEVWFDGACGEGPNGRRQVYDFPGFIELIRRYQPNAVIFHDAGPDIRWCGNEAGQGRAAEWAVVPKELCSLSAEITPVEKVMDGSLKHLYRQNPLSMVGDLSMLLYSEGLVFCGSEIDTSIHRGWFYHPEEEPHSVEKLMNIYLASVGDNACLNLNIPPMPNGRMDPRDVERLKEFGDALRAAFGTPLALLDAPRPAAMYGPNQPVYHVDLGGEKEVHYVVLEEDIAQGQRVESFGVYLTRNGFRDMYPAEDGLTIGHKRILRLDRKCEGLDVDILAARGPVNLRRITVY